MARRGAQKAQQFIAHEGQVNCLKIGRQSVGVLATGGDDCKVNLWTIGRPAAILSLTGHSTAVTSVTFDKSEQRVLAGSRGGTIKVWDIEESKVLSTMSGHRTAVQVVDFHPFSSFFASGSLDTNVKLWDWRQRGCAFIFKGHKRSVSNLVYSPDGKWIVSGGDDSVVKIWDTTAGKMLHEFTLHTAPITSIQFNPCELVLATASTDKTVRFWDLDTFELISTCGPEATAPRATCFTPDGNCLLTAYGDGLRVYDYDPVATFDYVDVAWSKVYDLAVLTGDRSMPGYRLKRGSGDQSVLGCSLSQNSVGVWIYPVSKIRMPSPIEDEDDQQAAKSDDAASNARTARQRPELESMTRSSSARAPIRERVAASDGPARRSQAPVLLSPSRMRSSSAHVTPTPPERSASQPIPDAKAPCSTSSLDMRASDRVDDSIAPTVSSRPPEASSASSRRPPQLHESAERRPRSRRGKPFSHHYSIPGESDSDAPRRHQRRATASADVSNDSFFDMQPPHTTASRSESHLHADRSQEAAAATSDLSTADGFKTSMSLGHGRFVETVTLRQSNLDLVKLPWRRGDMKGVLSTLGRCSDATVVADVLSEIVHRKDIMTLDACIEAAPAVVECLKSMSDAHKRAAITFYIVLLGNFAQVIREATASRSTIAIGVDLSAEERRTKCLAARSALDSLCPLLEKCVERPGGLGPDAERLLDQIKGLS